MTRSQLVQAAELLTWDQVVRRLAADSALRPIALTCVLPAIRYGDEWRFRRSDLEQWIGGKKGREGAEGFAASDTTVVVWGVSAS